MFSNLDSVLQLVRQWQLPSPQHQILYTPQWDKQQCVVRIDNLSANSLQLGPIDLFSGQLPENAQFHGEGFQMLAQNYGSAQHITAIGRCPDAGEYRLSEDRDHFTAYNQLLIECDGQYTLLGFSSCERFSGYFKVYPDGRLIIGIDTDTLAVAARHHITSESLFVGHNASREALLEEFAEAIEQQHPRLQWPSKPNGWCSWYHYYADISAADIEENLQQLISPHDQLEYLLIDDGYQEFMGDWLYPSERFSGGVENLCKRIREQGKEPAIWVAPFIAQAESRLFQQHPEWFVKNQFGQPLAAEEVTYGGWRCTPWYVLDTTQPDVNRYLHDVFSHMYHHWGVRYFKLDAIYWGTLAKGYRADPNKTRIEAYRMGMETINKACNGDAYILGCNAPMWPSLGLVHGMRIADDVDRNIGRFKQIAKETFFRNWQDQRLWHNDPDCVTLNNIPHQQTTAAAYNWHRISVLASSGLVFSGDRLNQLNAQQRDVLTVLEQNSADAARFDDFSLQHAKQYQQQQLVRQYWFNWSEQQSLHIEIELDSEQWQVLWADADFTVQGKGDKQTIVLAPNSAVVFERKA
ncbi:MULTISPECIES: glycoside hydrolase family 36 protein [unclassified Agarivorans]|uniref:glycoside hydrolase family 36 protein n=1 Tax=unclassified Agarivorans TaxID=2636026 RepID=UPI0026E1B49A|nr:MULTISPECIES: glycoside hydrolase family 36 protein [unclassified Agarivorans]MDO6686453.1 alpha-galactosidase [Agarivorans sp. 3_MG-2023]MDO6713755.1 alpha-galactosidase [Agarivorans sp. 2_MG-2023]